MTSELFQELKSLLQGSDSKLRKHWAEKIARRQIPLNDLISLLHGQKKTAQRFTWLIGDLLDTDRSLVGSSLPMLFELRDQMPFPGMQRTVAKCLWYLNVPADLEEQAIPQLFEWLANDQVEIGVKHYASKALYDLAIDGRIDAKRIAKIFQILEKEANHSNKAYATRTEKLKTKLQKELGL